MHVAVVGSGPAGLSAALFLSSHGVETTVIDRFRDRGFARYHSICGAGISDQAFKGLDLIRPDNILDRVERAELVFPGDVVVGMKVKGYVLDRVAFLRGLKDRCMENGCRFVTSEVRSVERRDDGFDIRTSGYTVHSDRVIGCDGAFSVVRRDLFGTRPEMIPAVEYIIDGIPEKVFRIEVGERFKGLYQWSFPAGDGISIGSGRGFSVDGYRTRGARYIPFGGVDRISYDGAYLAGDAAGMANPVSYGGLKAALTSGQEAAREIVEGRSYQRWWDRSIMSSVRFMGFRDTMLSWTDEDFKRASKAFKGCRNIYVSGLKATLTHPGYLPMYIGCLMTFRHSW